MSFFRLVSFLITFAHATFTGGLLTSISGEVKLNGREVVEPVSVQPGAVIETGANGKCSLLVGGSNVVHIGPNSRMEFTKHELRPGQGEDTQFRLEKGTTRSVIRSKGEPRRFTVRTRSAVMGVRGTHILIDSPADPRLPERFVTLEGAASVEFTGTRGGSPPSPPVLLHANELISSPGISAPGGSGPGPGPGGLPPPITHLSAQESLALSNAILPPPKDAPGSLGLRPRGDRPDQDLGLEKEFGFNQDRPRGPLFDPLRDGAIPVGVDLSAKRKK